MDAKLRKVSDLSAIARAAESGGCTVIMSGVKLKSVSDLSAIGRAGKGHIVFEE